MITSLRILIIEDSEADAILLLRHIRRAGYDIYSQRVDTPEAMQEALQQQKWDIIISDYSMPRFNGIEALQLLKATGLDIPFIMVSGVMGEQTAVEAMRAGAHDYLVKDNLKRLVPAVEREIQEANERRARRVAEDQVNILSHALAQSASLVMMTDISGIVEYVNPTFCEVTEYTTDEIIGQPALQFVNIPDMMCNKIQQEGEFHQEILNIRKGGTHYWTSLTITPVRDRDGTIRHCLAMQEDITERKQLEAQLHNYTEHLEGMVEARTAELSEKNRLLQQEIAERELVQTKLAIARDKALEALRLKNQILANVNHDMQTPLSVINLCAYILEPIVQETQDEKRINALEKILAETNHLSKYLRQILTIADTEASKIELQQIPFAPAAFLKDMLAAIQPLAEKKDLDLSGYITEAVPEVIIGDPERLREVLMQLLSNAVGFTEQGSVEVHIDRQKDSQWQIVVKDTGPGIPHKSQPYIFDLFWQVDGSTTRPTSRGSGLGLVIVKQYTELMGGYVHVTSDGQHGSTFKIILPLIEMENVE